MPRYVPKKHHLDKNAARLIEYGKAAGAPDDRLNTKATADLLNYVVGTLELMRIRGDGPRFEKLSGRVLYRRSDVIEWLEECDHRHKSTSEYRTHPQPNGRTKPKLNGAAAPEANPLLGHNAGPALDAPTETPHRATWARPDFRNVNGAADELLSGNPESSTEPIKRNRFTRGN